MYSCIISFSIKPLNKGYHPAKIKDAIMLLILNLSTINYFPFQSFHAKKKEEKKISRLTLTKTNSTLYLKVYIMELFTISHR